MKNWIIRLGTGHPKLVYLVTLLLVLATGALMPKIQIDTDPESMLSTDQPDRVFHNYIKQRFDMHDAIVVGVVQEQENGIYNPETLSALYRVTRAILQMDGVIPRDTMSISEADNITQEGAGTLRFEWMMPEPPKNQARADEIREAMENLPMLLDTLVAGDGKAAAIYVPIESKDESYRLSREIGALLEQETEAGEWHITGLPVAEDTFGNEMFVQMGISAPLAAVMIFFLMLYFFRNLRLVISPMIVAMSTVIVTMGLLIGMGFTVHIMSSMIPIFLMPIAVVDSIHIMSEFADTYRAGDDPREVMRRVVGHLFKPMLFTSTTSAVGFASLLLTPIPPVQVFGAFVAFGILFAFLLTVVFIPAFIVRSKPESLAGLDRLREGSAIDTPMARRLRSVGRFAFSRSGMILSVAVVALVISIAGIARIQINDNPLRWFKDSHRVRIADKVLNEHFAGTYDAFFVFTYEDPGRWQGFVNEVMPDVSALPAYPLLEEALQVAPDPGAVDAALGAFIVAVDDALFEATTPEEVERLELLMAEAEATQVDGRYFQRPEVLEYISAFQLALVETGFVGKTNAITDIVKVVNRELRSGTAQDFVIPDSANGVAQTLLQYQSSHRPTDLWHFVSTDFQEAPVWLQLKSGDNQDMDRVIQAVDSWIAENPLPEGVRGRWAGKTYINVVWQAEMVRGMLNSLLGAFAFVFFMMAILFRSVIWGLVAMLPLSLTIIGVYGLIGWTGKYYDMPIAVLSSLTLGLSVDFAIHFIQRTRELAKELGSFAAAAQAVFEEPARAIFRNAVVIALGFTPLFLAPLIPYVTVGAFMSSIMLISGVATLLVLPAAMTLLKNLLFPENLRRES